MSVVAHPGQRMSLPTLLEHRQDIIVSIRHYLRTRPNAVIMQPELLPSLTDSADCGAILEQSVLIILGWLARLSRLQTPDYQTTRPHGAAPRPLITHQRSEQRRGATQLMLTAALCRVRDYSTLTPGPPGRGLAMGCEPLKLPSRAYGRLLHVSLPVHGDDRLHDLGSDGVYQACCLTPNHLHPGRLQCTPCTQVYWPSGLALHGPPGPFALPPQEQTWLAALSAIILANLLLSQSGRCLREPLPFSPILMTFLSPRVRRCQSIGTVSSEPLLLYPTG